MGVPPAPVLSTLTLMGCPHMYSAGPRTSIACLSAALSEVELQTEGRERVPMMGEGPRESCDLLFLDKKGRETSTRELLVLPGALPAAFSSSHTREGDHFTKFLSSVVDSTYSNRVRIMQGCPDRF